MTVFGKCAMAAALVFLPVAALAADGDVVDIRPRWSVEKADAWYAEQPWLVGCNFIPSTAINQLEMWQADSFDEETIDRELGWAAGLGFNTARVYLHDLLWADNPEGFCERIDRFLDIASSHDIRPLFVLFDDCWNSDPKLGVQPEPKPGTHNSGWVQSPGEAVVKNPAEWPRLEAYTKGVLKAFGDDERVLMWDLYNEPGNSKLGDATYDLLHSVVLWAQAADPSQPLTVGMWNASPAFDRLNTLQYAASDVISFHEYGPLDALRKRVDRLREFGRPLVCTEYMARTLGSRFEVFLPVFKWERIACCNWGLVSGKTNTLYQWNVVLDHEPEVWFHDIFRKDGTPYRTSETDLIRELTGAR